MSPVFVRRFYTLRHLFWVPTEAIKANLLGLRRWFLYYRLGTTTYTLSVDWDSFDGLPSMAPDPLAYEFVSWSVLVSPLQIFDAHNGSINRVFFDI